MPNEQKKDALDNELEQVGSLTSAATPLIASDNQLLARVNQLIKKAKKKKSATHANDYSFTHPKYLAALFLLSGKLIASGSYRYINIAFMTMYFFQLIEKDHWTEAETFSKAVGLYFGVADIIITLAGSKKSAFRLCLQPDWLSGSRKIAQDIWTGEIPRGLSAVTPFTIAASAYRGFVGSKMLFQLLSSHPAEKLENIFFSLQCMISVASGICYFAFQIYQQALTVVRIEKSLDANEALKKQLLKEERFLIHFNSVLSTLITIAMALVSGASIFYNKTNSDGKNNIDLSWQTLLPALCFVIPTAVQNIFYTYNKVYLFWLLQDKYEHSKEVARRNVIPCSLQVTALTIAGISNSFGTGLSAGASVFLLSLVLSGSRTLSDENTTLRISISACVFLLVALIFPRDFTMWLRTILDEFRKKNNQEKKVAVSDADKQAISVLVAGDAVSIFPKGEMQNTRASAASVESGSPTGITPTWS